MRQTQGCKRPTPSLPDENQRHKRCPPDNLEGFSGAASYLPLVLQKTIQMKKICTFLPLFFLFFALNAQQSVKRYVTLEHFTNSKCPICANKNPAFYTLINQYPNDIHHIAVHPPYPYNTCVFYQANTTENTARAALYSIQGTPQVAVNGVLAPLGSTLLPAATLQAQLNQTSPLYVKVTETGGSSRTVNIEARSVGNVPAGNYKLYVAVVEKQINYNAPNGETVHHDVFRKMLPDISGIDYVPAAQGQSVNYTLNYSVNSNWNAAEVYVVAFIQNTMTKEVLNSGTKFDPVFTGTQNPETAQVLAIPNPASDLTSFMLPQATDVEQVEVFNLNGIRVQAPYTRAQDQLSLDVSALSAGVYLVKIDSADRVYTAKLLKI